VNVAGSLARPRSLLRRPDAMLAFVAGSVSLALAYYTLLLRETTFHRVVAADASRPVYGVVVAGLALGACVLFGINVAGLYVLARARTGRRLSFATASGGLVGAFGAGCPSCGAFLLSAVGVSGGLAVLPLAGIELWAAACLLMAVTGWSAMRRLRRCTEGECAALPPPSRIHMAALSAVALGSAATLTTLIALNG
jgi:hypothetical protein